MRLKRILEAQEKQARKPQGDEAMNALFKQILCWCDGRDETSHGQELSNIGWNID
jgi:hypothetical protein